MISIAILGSTGSVGCSTLEVVRQFPDRLRVETIAAFGSDVDALVAQIEAVRPSLVAVFDGDAAAEVERRSEGVEVVAGAEGVVAAATDPRVDRVVAAMVGAAGLPPAHAALAAGKALALANTEALVVGGELLVLAGHARPASPPRGLASDQVVQVAGLAADRRQSGAEARATAAPCNERRHASQRARATSRSARAPAVQA